MSVDSRDVSIAESNNEFSFGLYPALQSYADIYVNALDHDPRDLSVAFGNEIIDLKTVDLQCQG